MEYPKKVKILGLLNNPPGGAGYNSISATSVGVFDADTGQQLMGVQSFGFGLSIDDALMMGQFVSLRPTPEGPFKFEEGEGGTIIEDTFEAEIVEINLKAV
jgi:hypothetical protein